ncbi:hypothetical protein QR680_004827 [Steinernema hermaphroditum]|uniref:Succinate dehydrogenase assembly factor 3 n=1 Tax=Steinernema hermaphroditum TaxID=289476 RepID=A0AA39LUB5_9BILA|nr:hypothetical protein QR680_004827 [Steinernema hermaphroditum]
MSGAAAKTAVQKIAVQRFPLVLYKRILRLHYGLPKEMRYMGDQYVKDEFRRHRDADSQQALVFLHEWTQYCTMLAKQLSTSGIAKGALGKQLSPEMLDTFADEQLHQLLELKIESEGNGEGAENAKEQ